MAGLFRLVTTVQAAQVPVWSGTPASFAFVYGVAKSYSIAAYISTLPPVTLTQVGVWPAGITLNSAAKTINSTIANVLGTTVVTILASDGVGNAVQSPPISLIVALGQNAPVWNATTFISVQRGNTFSLSTLCTDPDKGDVITWSPLLTLPVGVVTLNTVTGLLTVAAGAAIGSYNVRFRATDTTLRVADSAVLTLSVTGILASVSWSAMPNTFPLSRSGSLDVGANAASSAAYAMTFTLASGTLPSGVTFNAGVSRCWPTTTTATNW